MLDFINLYLNSIILWITAYYFGIKLLDSKPRSCYKPILIILILSLLLAILNLLSADIINGIIKILCVYILQCTFFKITFTKNISKSITLAFIWFLCLCLSETLAVTILGLILNLFGITLDVLKNNIGLNFLIAIFIIGIMLVFKEKFKTFLNNDLYIERSTYIITFTMLLLLAILGFRRPVVNLSFDIEFFITIILLLCFCIIGLYLLKQKSDIQKTSSMYQQLAEYSEMTNKVLEEYRMINHEHKNQLSIIRQMSDNKNIKLIEYLDNLLKTKNDIKYKWVGELNYIPLDGLKGLINYKLIEISENKIKVTINISKEIKNIKLNKLNSNQKDNLYSIIGIYLDNAIDAAVESKEKEINIEIYREKKELIFVIGNTYGGTIKLEKINEYGYSSKGKNHGVGLHIVRKILEESKIFTQKTKLLDNYFIQELKINTANIKNK